MQGGADQGGEYAGLKRVCQGGGGELGTAICRKTGYILNVKIANVKARRIRAKSTFDLAHGDILEEAVV